jgi:3-polyprenyl-4-hydroxybenzoate decarboxylase
MGVPIGKRPARSGSPLQLVGAETVDLLIPAAAEIAIEGSFRTDILEMEGPFGEYGGYVGAYDYQMVFEVCAILQIAGSAQVVVIELHDPVPGEAWDTLRAAASARNVPSFKWVIAVDDDIDSNELDSLIWALAWRVQPHKDIQIQRGRNTDLDPSGAPVEASFADRTYPDGLDGSQILIDATRNWAYPPVSLPSKDLMEHAKDIWEDELHLPALRPCAPWHGYGLGYWPDGWARAAQRAIDGQYLDTGKEYASRRTRSSYFDDGIVREPREENRCHGND